MAGALMYTLGISLFAAIGTFLFVRSFSDLDGGERF